MLAGIWKSKALLLAVALVEIANGATFDQDILVATLTTPTGIRILGQTVNTNFGTSVSPAGDVNGDKIGDIIVGSPAISAGIVYVLFGRPNIRNTLDFDLSFGGAGFVAGPNIGFRIVGPISGGKLGAAVSSAGDINHDGIDDVVVGAPAAGIGGIVYVIFGRNVAGGATAFSDILLANVLSLADGFSIVGAASGDQAGAAVSAARDVNGDGVDDIIIGAPFADPPALTAATDGGIAYVIFGRDISLTNVLLPNMNLNTLTPTTGFRMFGGTIGGNCGISVAGLGDINGDGKDDVIVGVPNNPTGTSNGYAHVIYGRPAGGPVFNDITLASVTSTVGFLLTGSNPGDGFGYAVNTAGDVNGDGIQDIIVGARSAEPSPQPTTFNCGISYVVYGRSNQAAAFADFSISLVATTPSFGFRILGAASNDLSGSAVSSAGDINGDGVDDVLVGASNAEIVSGVASTGIAYIVFGRKGAAPFGDVLLSTIISGSPNGFRVGGAVGSDQLGYAVCAAGDIDGSGGADILVSAPFFDAPNARTNGGIVYVLFGTPYAPTSQPSAQPSRQPSAQPSRQPTRQPSSQPSGQPTRVPTTQPSLRPSSQPTRQPTLRPSTQPSSQPSARPTFQPTVMPSVQPTSQPSRIPTVQPTGRPTCQPTSQPSARPSAQPVGRPSSQPSAQPTAVPTSQPSTQPSCQPSRQPSTQPSGFPSVQPTGRPSLQPSARPSALPSGQPSSQPTIQPSARPSKQPTSVPSGVPSSQPSAQPTGAPSTQPSTEPSCQPSTQPSVAPSGQPTVQPSCDPSSQPSRQPSSLPTVQPSVQPSAHPSSQPSSLPSAQPTCKPSAQPSSLPSGQPSTQPSALPSTQPTLQPSSRPSVTPTSQPTTGPTSQPTDQPSDQPSSKPSTQPTVLPSARPSAQPSVVPTARPSLGPTGEWVSVLARDEIVRTVAHVGENVWGCGQSRPNNVSACTLHSIQTGQVVTQHEFGWDRVVSLFTTRADGVVVVVGTSTQQCTTSSDAAVCHTVANELQCLVESFAGARFLAASYLSYPNRIVYVGTYNVYVSATIIDVTPDTVRSFIYTLFNMKAVVLSQVQSPPNFIGSFVAGTAVRSAGAPVNYIIAGMLRTDTGGLTAMALYPATGEIISTVDLVTSVALENSGPDLFVVGGLELSDGAGVYAYLLRVNALYSTVLYCVRYRVAGQVHEEHRRLQSGVTSQSVTRGVALVGNDLYMIIDHTSANVTSLVAMRVKAVNGAIIKQVHISALNASLKCTDISAAGLFLAIACAVQSDVVYSVIMNVDKELSFGVLPPGFRRTTSVVYEPETVPFKRSIVTVTSKPTEMAVTRYEFNTGEQTPTRHPSAAPSSQPSGQPSSAPSAQPSSSPTAAPTVSARPTSQPSSATPTSTHKPTVVLSLSPTIVPTVVMTLPPTKTPTLRPTMQPSIRPSTRPSPAPSVTPSVRESKVPTTKPTRAPVVQRSVRPTTAPTTVPTVQVPLDESGGAESGNKRPTVVGASIGAAVGVFLCGYLLYKHRQHTAEEEARAKRKVEYFRQQELLVAAMEKEREEMIQQIRAEDEEKRQKKVERELRKQYKEQHYRPRGAYAVSPALQVQGCPPAPQHVVCDVRLSDSTEDSIDLSSLHSSEMSYVEYDTHSEHSDNTECIGEHEEHSSEWSLDSREGLYSMLHSSDMSSVEYSIASS